MDSTYNTERTKHLWGFASYCTEVYAHKSVESLLIPSDVCFQSDVMQKMARLAIYTNNFERKYSLGSFIERKEVGSVRSIELAPKGIRRDDQRQSNIG